MKLNLGCGKDIKDGWVNVDQIAFPGVDLTLSLTSRWPWADGEVEEIYASHVLEHFDSFDRCFVLREMYRVLQPGGKATVIVPHWGSGRAYGDPTHKWPPVSEMSFYYLSRAWRDQNAPHVEEHLPVDFEATWGYVMSPQVATRNMEWQQFAITHYREAAMDIHATLTKR